MKRIFTLLLLFPLALNAMERNATSKPLYVGVLTHVTCEATWDGEPCVFPCEQDMIVYQRNNQTKTFNYLTRTSENYITPDTTSVIRTNPKELSLFDFQISKVEISQRGEEPIASINYDFTKYNESHVLLYSGDSFGTYQIGIASAIELPPNSNNATTKKGGTLAIFCRHGATCNYAPGMTSKAVILYNQTPHVTSFSTNEPVNSSTSNFLSKIPGSNPFAIVIAFLELKKDNDQYIPIPSKNSPVYPKQDNKDDDE